MRVRDAVRCTLFYRCRKVVLMALLVGLGGCVGDLGGPSPRRAPDYRDLVWREESSAYRAALEFYEKTGELPSLGSEPKCVVEAPPCIVERAKWEGRNELREHLFNEALACKEGQTECARVRSSETAMRKLVHRRWKKAREAEETRQAELRAWQHARLRDDEAAKLSDWQEMKQEEAAAREAREREQQLAAVPPPVAPTPTIPHDWDAEARAVVVALRSQRVGCSWGFGETEYSDRAWALATLEAMGPGDAARVAEIVDRSHGRGAFRVIVSRAQQEMQAFVPRRCVAGL